MAYMRNVARQIPNLPLSQNEGNSGPIDSTTFSASEQLVNVGPGSGHQYQDPGPNDKRGPCPGLNAAANHDFLPRNGRPNIQQSKPPLLIYPSLLHFSPKRSRLMNLIAVNGLAAAYGFGHEFAAALAVIAIALTGDPIGQRWSIGGPFSPALPLLSNPTGISWSHNTYEADASIVRQDAYLNNGDAVSVIISQVEELLALAENNEFTLDILRTHNKAKHDYSVANNPYFFQAVRKLQNPSPLPFLLIGNHLAD